MKEITLNAKPALVALTIIATLGLASCSNQTIQDTDTTPPATGGTTTPEPVPAPQPPAPEIDMTGFVVQLIASERSERAEEIRNQFDKEGYTVFVNPLQQGGKTLYRVQIGPHGTEQDARRVLNNMKIRYPINGLVQQAVIKQNR